MSEEETGVPTRGNGLLRTSRSRSYGSLVRSPVSPLGHRRVEHHIQPGETLQGLALKYGVSVSAKQPLIHGLSVIKTPGCVKEPESKLQKTSSQGNKPLLTRVCSSASTSQRSSRCWTRFQVFPGVSRRSEAQNLSASVLARLEVLLTPSCSPHRWSRSDEPTGSTPTSPST